GHKVVFRHDTTRMFDQHPQRVERLGPKVDLIGALGKRHTLKIENEDAEPIAFRGGHCASRTVSDRNYSHVRGKLQRSYMQAAAAPGSLPVQSVSQRRNQWTA